MKKGFKFLLCALILCTSVGTANAATRYWCVRVVSVLDGGGTSKSKVYAGTAIQEDATLITQTDYTMAEAEPDDMQYFYISFAPATRLNGTATVNEVNYAGIYTDAACTQEIYPFSQGSNYLLMSVPYQTTRYSTKAAAEANPTTYYLKFGYPNVTGANRNDMIIRDPNGTGTSRIDFTVEKWGGNPSEFGWSWDRLSTGSSGDYGFVSTDIKSISIKKSDYNKIRWTIQYTAKNIHSGNTTPDYVGYAMLRAKNLRNNTNNFSRKVCIYVDLQPKFTLNTTSMDWSHEGETLVETVYVGMEVPASARTRLKDKLVIPTPHDDTNNMARNHATWTATITGTNADQFKFANGTQTVTGSYSADLLDVIYAPQVAGDHTANLHVVTSYTDAKGVTLKDSKDVLLAGKAESASKITFIAEGSVAPSDDESHDFGNIIGTNHKDLSAVLNIVGVSGLTKTWSDPDGAFEFDADDVDLTQVSQQLTFRAHHSIPVTEVTNHTATLTISGTGSEGPLTGVLTLTYTAKPLLTPEVTWNWDYLEEYTTTGNPITTNSDGEWTLLSATDNKVIYDAETKQVTTPWLHHEPDVKAAFALSIPQTDTYEAFVCDTGSTIQTMIPPTINFNSQEVLNANKLSGTSSDVIYQAENNSIHISIYSTAQLAWNGQNLIEFDIDETTPGPVYIKSVKGYTETMLSDVVLTPGNYKFKVPYDADKVIIRTNGDSHADVCNLRFYEYDTIDTRYTQVPLVRDGDAISSLDMPVTFANKQQVTVSLNATAAQYFELSSAGKETGASIVFNESDGLAIRDTIMKTITVAFKAGANAADAQQAALGNGCTVTFSDSYTYNHEEHTLPILVLSPAEVTYKHSANGSYTVSYLNVEPQVVSAADFVKEITTGDPSAYVVTLSAPTPASGYLFRGWKIDGNVVSYKSSLATSIGKTCEVEAVFAPTEAQNFRVGDAFFADLAEAIAAVQSVTNDSVVTVAQDVVLGDGATPITYTIPAHVTLLVPHKADFFDLQETPEVLSPKSMEEVLAAYRTLTLTKGVTINCNGNICVAGKLLSTGGGNKSAYTTGECGVINMVSGGHIELNDGANLYCWGYIKGQDMDQGNNTVGTGTVTANAGSVVWENFELGDWRGGTASMDIYSNNVRDHRKLFPFQSYAIQNIEIPTSFKYGSTLRTFTSITTGMGHHDAVFSMISNENTMFLLQDEQSMVRTWYDPTTDLTCYELSGTAQLDALHIVVYIEMSSEDFILPICNSMHIILTNCNMTLAKPLMQQAGSIIEIKPDATVNLENELYLYDKDQWGLYVHNYYFRSFNNLTSHKNRGAENSKDGLDDAKLIVDGIFNIQNGGKLYTTAGGANVMGNHGGQIHFMQTLPAPSILWAVTVSGQKPYINWEYNDVAAANLCNENGSYTRSIGGATFYNVHGRWFDSEDKDAKADHTYNFRYMVDEDKTHDIATDAVYSHDKTGLEERMKWFNVAEDETPCADWWKDASNRFYNYSMLGEWHQFIATETENVYSGSNNVLYRKAGCDWAEEGYIDENCLYTIGGVKKALVNGVFIPLTPNSNDPAYHKSDDASKYYICFKGCNWHPATKYAGESKAYTIHPEDEDLHYIWFNSDWLNVLRDGAFFYTEDEQTNVRTYYEYLNGDWMVATPYVSVTDAAETRTFYVIKEAFNVAQIKKNATITLLRDLPNVTEVLTYETQNTTCTLDLNGHLLGGNLANLITVNAPSATFTITDNSDLKNGKILNEASKAVYVQKGALVVANGTIESTGAYAIEGAATTTITINGGYFAADTKCVNVNGNCSISGGYFNLNTGLDTYRAPHKYLFATDDPKYRWTVETAWSITFKKDEETTLQTLLLKPGEMPVYTEAQPTKDGYKFTGWNTPIVAATADATYTAQFAEIEEGEKCVTLNSNGGNEGLQYIYVASGSAVGTLPTATKEGYTFAGWWTAAVDGDPVNAETTVSADVTWYAHYTINSYTLTWNLAGGVVTVAGTGAAVDATGTQSIDLNYGAAITAPTVTKAGCEFLGGVLRRLQRPCLRMT